MAKGMVDDCIGLMVVYSVDRYFGIGSFVGTSHLYKLCRYGVFDWTDVCVCLNWLNGPSLITDTVPYAVEVAAAAAVAEAMAAAAVHDHLGLDQPLQDAIYYYWSDDDSF